MPQNIFRWIASILLSVVSLGEGVDVTVTTQKSLAWRLTNTKSIHVVWRIRTLQFFDDIGCKNPINAVVNQTGVAFGNPAAYMTNVENVFMLGSMKGWESSDVCHKGDCHIGFEFDTPQEINGIMIQQGAEGFHAEEMALQKRSESGTWLDVVTWTNVSHGRSRMSTACPEPPSVPDGKIVGDCPAGDLFRECAVQCDLGRSTIEPRVRCINGAWFVPACIPIGSAFRFIAQAPSLIKPFWVILDIEIFTDPDCKHALGHFKGVPFSSGEVVIKYASYNPGNAWDGNENTSWASKDPCTPGACFIGFKFDTVPEKPIQCAKIKHAQGRNHQASVVTYELLGDSGWETKSINIKLLPEGKGEEL